MLTPLNIANAAVSVDPFAHFSVASAMPEPFAIELLHWLERSAPWKHVATDFYEQFEFSLFDAIVPEQLAKLRERAFLRSLSRQLGEYFSARLDEQHIDVTVHKLVCGQRIRIHNDFIPGRETHRLLIQLNRSWTQERGGLLMLFKGPQPEDVCKLVAPSSRSAFGFAISQRSYHAVAPVVSGERFTLVYSFYGI